MNDQLKATIAALQDVQLFNGLLGMQTYGGQIALHLRLAEFLSSVTHYKTYPHSDKYVEFRATIDGICLYALATQEEIDAFPMNEGVAA